ncbi:MAG: CHAT domain-containing protein, partial [Anaerolineales bacterium]|nr:CHAT domain-containing protein [Anaerolineales bacterium]
TQLATKLELALELPAAASSPSSPAQPNGQMVALQQRWHWLQNRLESPFTLLDDTARRELDPEQLRQELRQVEMELAELHRRQQAGTLVNTPARATSAPTPAPERPDPGTAVLHFYQVDDQCQALLISATGSQLFSGLASTRFISQWQRAWRLHLDQISQFGDGPAERASATAYLQMLHDKLLAPILAAQPDMARWQLVLPPEWHDLPLAAAFDGDQYLCERHVLCYGQSLQPVPPFAGGALTGPALLVGHSDGGRLPHVAVELQAIARCLNRPDTTVLSETEATVAALQAHLPTCRLLHIATHALFRPDNPLFSWLRLADQRLTIQALAQFELAGQPLVVLSACETGRGRPRGGGLQGLARTLRQAGASALIVSQWRTEDLANAELMAHFYDALATGQPPAQALTGAQQAMAASGRHPFYWSGYL